MSQLSDSQDLHGVIPMVNSAHMRILDPPLVQKATSPRKRRLQLRRRRLNNRKNKLKKSLGSQNSSDDTSSSNKNPSTTHLFVRDEDDIKPHPSVKTPVEKSPTRLTSSLFVSDDNTEELDNAFSAKVRDVAFDKAHSLAVEKVLQDEGAKKKAQHEQSSDSSSSTHSSQSEIIVLDDDEEDNNDVEVIDLDSDDLQKDSSNSSHSGSTSSNLKEGKPQKPSGEVQKTKNMIESHAKSNKPGKHVEKPGEAKIPSKVSQHPKSVTNGVQKVTMLPVKTKKAKDDVKKVKPDQRVPVPSNLKSANKDSQVKESINTKASNSVRDSAPQPVEKANESSSKPPTQMVSANPIPDVSSSDTNTINSPTHNVEEELDSNSSTKRPTSKKAAIKRRSSSKSKSHVIKRSSTSPKRTHRSSDSEVHLAPVGTTLARRTRSATRKPVVIDLTLDSSESESESSEDSDTDDSTSSEPPILKNSEGVVVDDNVSRILESLNYSHKEPLDVRALMPAIEEEATNTDDLETVAVVKTKKKSEPLKSKKSLKTYSKKSKSHHAKKLAKKPVKKPAKTPARRKHRTAKIPSNKRIQSDILSVLESRKSKKSSARKFRGVPIDYKLPRSAPAPVYSTDCLCCQSKKRGQCNRQDDCNICRMFHKVCSYPPRAHVINDAEINMYSKVLSMKEHGIWQKRYQKTESSNSDSDSEVVTELNETRKQKKSRELGKRLREEGREQPNKKRKLKKKKKKTTKPVKRSKSHSSDDEWSEGDTDPDYSSNDDETFVDADNELKSSSDSSASTRGKTVSRTKWRKRCRGRNSSAGDSDEEEEIAGIPAPDLKAARILNELNFENRDLHELFEDYGTRRKRRATRENYIDLPDENELSDLSEGERAYKEAEDAAQPIILSDDEVERRMLRGQLPEDYVASMRREQQAVEEERVSDSDHDE